VDAADNIHKKDRNKSINTHTNQVNIISSSMQVAHHALLALGSCAMPSITAPNPLLTSINSALSAGSCLHMSSLAIKILSRYIHLRCTVNIISTTSPMQPRAASQASTCRSNDSAIESYLLRPISLADAVMQCCMLSVHCVRSTWCMQACVQQQQQLHSCRVI
jgi:hypothetical protein